MSNRNSERRASERHTMNVLTEYLKEREGLNLKDRKEFDPPDPDFIVRVKEENIGVEVTNFSTNGDQFESNGFLDKVLKFGKQIFRGNGGPALHVSVHFSNQPRNCQAEDLGKRLASVVQIMLEDNVTDTCAYSREDLDVLFSKYELLDYVSAISVYSIVEEGELWQSPRSDWGPTTVSAEDLQKIIDEKNKKLVGYRRNCESVWLAIDNRLEAGFYAISDEAMQFSYRHDLIESFGLKCVKGILSHVMSLFYQLSEKICLNHVLMCFKYTNFV